MNNIDLSRYAGNAEDTKVQTDPENAKESRMRMYGIIPIDALKTMDKRRFAVVADATLDEIERTYDHLFAYLDLCDTCEEPATRVATVKAEDRLDKPKEHACDVCKFSKGAKQVKPHPQAEIVHRVKALLAMIKERR